MTMYYFDATTTERGSVEHISEGERIIKLMLYIREAGPVSFADIRRHFPYEYGNEAGNPESVRRRFERDKNTLQELGLYLHINADRRYSLDIEKSIAAPLMLTKPQISLLRLLCNALLEDASYPFKKDLRMVLVKLGDELEIPDMLPAMLENSKRKADSEIQGLAKIRKAITNRKRLSFSYTNSQGVESAREVEPFGCFFLKDQCYVVAYDPSVEDERLFRADRIKKLHVNALNRSKPDFDERPFDAYDHYGLPFQFGEEEFEALVFFDEGAAHKARSLTMGRGELTPEKSGFLWHVKCRDSYKLARWCIENGPGVHIIEPIHAVQVYADGIQEFISAMNKQGGCSSENGGTHER